MAPKRSLDEFEGDDEFAISEGAITSSDVLTNSTTNMKRLKTHHNSSKQDATRKRKYDLYKLDEMEQDISSADSDESELQYPRISTPLSVKYPRFDLSYDPDEEVESSPLSFASLTTLVDPSAVNGYGLTDVADDYYLSEEDEEALEQAEEGTPPPRMIRRRTTYGVVSVPVTSDNEEEEYITTDEEGSEADDEDDTKEPWNEREQQIFLVLVCDYGRNWRRFQPFFPRMSVDDVCSLPPYPIKPTNLVSATRSFRPSRC